MRGIFLAAILFAGSALPANAQQYWVQPPQPLVYYQPACRPVYYCQPVVQYYCVPVTQYYCTPVYSYPVTYSYGW